MMKKNLYFGLGALLALASCSNDDIIPDDVNVSDGANRYLSVNIVSTPESGTRAEGEQKPGQPSEENPNATYEEGYAKENAVKAVRFYFFDDAGNAVKVKAGKNDNYYETTPKAAGQGMPNIEKQLEAVVVINTKDGDLLPTQMVAVVNPDEASLGNGSKTLTELNTEIADYQAIAKNTDTEGSFVMTNSVYSTTNQPGGTEVYAVEIKKSDYYLSEDDAEHNPINIYVERNVAKVRLGVDVDSELKNDAGLIKLTDKDGKDILVNNRNVYLRIEAWDVTADTDKGYLKKHIDTNWPTDKLGAEPWNWSAYFRSFWATNPNGVANRYYSYDAIDQKDFTNKSQVYVNENAYYGTTRTDLYPTKVIIKGTLVDANDNPIEVYKYAGLTGAGAENLMNTMLNYLKKDGVLFSKTTSADGQTTTYSDIEAADVEFKTAMDLDKNLASEGTTGRYYVYLQLSTTGKDKTWVNSKTNDENTKQYTPDDVNTYLKDALDHAQIYKTGMTYYYFEIEHLGSDLQNNKPIYGVVRNHIYDATIKAITGLGTPVYNPEEDIYPEKPKDEFTYVGTCINILSWRVVPNNIELKW